MNEAASSWGVADATCRIFAEERIARRRQGLDDRPPHRRCIEREAQLANNLTPAACKEIAPESELRERHD